MTNDKMIAVRGDIDKLSIYTEINNQTYKWRNVKCIMSGCYDCKLVQDDKCIAPACFGNLGGWWEKVSKEV